MTIELQLPAERADLLARLHREGSVRGVEYDGESTRVVATIPTRSLEVFARFLPATAKPVEKAAPAVVD
jgi:YD repeat-containing protein